MSALLARVAYNAEGLPSLSVCPRLCLTLAILENMGTCRKLLETCLAPSRSENRDNTWTTTIFDQNYRFGRKFKNRFGNDIT